MAIVAQVALLTIGLASPQRPWVIGVEELYRLDLLPVFKRSIAIGAVTSYDRSGGNDDGFSGKYSFVRKEGDTLVLADLKGPGCIYRIHTPTPTDDPLDFYFDGETTPRLSITFNKLFSGTVYPFRRPLVDYAGGGATSYLPMPYKKSCKVVLRAKNFQFYDLNYATYPADAPVGTFDPKGNWHGVERAQEVFRGGRERDLTAFNVPPGTHLRTTTFDKTIPSFKAVTLFETKKPGRIASLRLSPAEAFAGKNRDLLLRITWDGDSTPSILCPVGDFFGYAWGKPAMGSCLVGSYNGVDYCNLPMPFDRAAKIELVSMRPGASITIHGEVVVGDTPRARDEGKFYAVWRRENPTTDGKPYTYLSAKGRGHLIGLALQAQGAESGNTFFFEGDDVTMIDGEMAIHGTGSEDSFNGGWYDVPDRWDGQFSRAFSGCLAYQRPLGRTGGYRFFVGDAYAYHSTIVQTIEHAAEKNRGTTDYCSVAYLYSDQFPPIDPKLGNPGTPEFRAARTPSTIIFSAHWTLPISSFSFADATLSRTSVPAGSQTERCLSFRAKGQDFFGLPFISFLCDMPDSGRYKVFVDVVKGPAQGTIQLFKDDTAVGDPVDLYSATPARANQIPVGQLAVLEGNNKVTFKIVGKAIASSALGFDLVNITFVKMSVRSPK